MDRRARLAPDADRLGHRRQEFVRFAADVAGIDAAVGRHNPGQGDQFVGLGIGTRRVDETRRHAPGPVAHGLGHQALHAFQLLGGRGTACGAEYRGTHRAVSHEVDDVRARTVFVDVLEEPGDVARSAAVAGAHRRAALEEVVQAGADAGAAERSVGVRVEIDPSRGDDHTPAVDRAADLAGHDVADGHDPPVADRHVADHRRRARTVADRAAAE